MNFHLVTLFPELFDAFLHNGVIGGAHKKELFRCQFYNPRDFVEKNYKSVDATPYGGGDGMVMAYEPMKKCMQSITAKEVEVICLSPKGEVWNAQMAEDYASKGKDLVLISGRYAGIDQRFIYKYVDREISVGDFVVSGGELPSMLLMDSILRHREGVLGNVDSAKRDSFQEALLEPPCFTRPELIDEMNVPNVLKSGHHENISQWRESLSLILTAQKRPDLLANRALSEEERKRCKIFWQDTSAQERKLLGLEERFPF